MKNNNLLHIIKYIIMDKIANKKDQHYSFLIKMMGHIIG
jgi:hypothetical protein